ncbi:MAG: Vitamin B12-binding protein precursor [candidate division TA06 bacterium ADurb.Bin417]|uniref:Vitamin B12-binding protein n=1 Tax=candidate division TA06 bacterium ADurb.Bin417 TaxID=1852828 RepID=A0A1V5M794_UNCT6|nr:MAG: Vitamin B12-binding protein precursor [candidate division TA06 bacterium ADurb.Bin417]
MDLGLGERIVGLTEQDNCRPVLKKAVTVGFYIQPNLEKIAALKPDLVLFDVYPGQAETRRRLAGLGLKVESFEVRRLSDILAVTDRLGGLTGRIREAGRLNRRLKAQLERYRNPAGPGRPRVYLEVGHDPYFSAGRDSFLHELIELAGGRNIAGSLPGAYPRVDAEFIIAADPEVIILSGMDSGDARAVGRRPGWDRLSAVRSGRIHSGLGTHPLTTPSPRLILENLPVLHRILNSARR